MNMPSPSKTEVDTSPKCITPEGKDSSTVAAPKVPKKGIEVVATRKGFYNRERKNEGDKFIVKKKHLLGEWMTCTDPDLEVERIKFFKAKKINADKNSTNALKKQIEDLTKQLEKAKK